MTTETSTTDATNQEGAGSQTAATEATAQAAASDATAQAAGAAQQQQATDGQTTEAAKADDSGKTEGDTKQPAGAPEKYEFQTPEGATIDAKVLDQFSEVAKELNLPQESAQKILDKVGPVMAARQAEVVQAARTQWLTDSKADAEFGGAKLEENLAIAMKAREAFGTPELTALLNQSGLGDHPEIIRAFYRAGKAISEDRMVGGGEGTKEPLSTAQRMYPNMNP